MRCVVLRKYDSAVAFFSKDYVFWWQQLNHTNAMRKTYADKTLNANTMLHANQCVDVWAGVVFQTPFCFVVTSWDIPTASLKYIT